MGNDVRLMNIATAALLAVFALLLAGAGLIWGTRQSVFDLRRILVTGDLQHVNLPSMRASAVQQLRGNFFTINLAVARRAFESVPWVRHAKVSRRWPDTLVVDVEEHVPMALWADGRGVNTYGELFSVNAAELEQYSNLPSLEGPPGTEQLVAQRLRDFGAWFKPLGLAPETVALSNRYAWSVTLDDGMVVELGREQAPESLSTRVARFVGAFDQVKTRWGGVPETADLRYPNGFAVRIAGVRFIAPKEARSR